MVKLGTRPSLNNEDKKESETPMSPQEVEEGQKKMPRLQEVKDGQIPPPSQEAAAAGWFLSGLSRPSRIRGIAVYVVLILIMLAALTPIYLPNWYIQRIIYSVLYSLFSLVNVYAALFLVGSAEQANKLFGAPRWFNAGMMMVLPILTLLLVYQTPDWTTYHTCVMIHGCAVTSYYVPYVLYVREALSRE